MKTKDFKVLDKQLKRVSKGICVGDKYISSCSISSPIVHSNFFVFKDIYEIADKAVPSLRNIYFTVKTEE